MRFTPTVALLLVGFAACGPTPPPTTTDAGTPAADSGVVVNDAGTPDSGVLVPVPNPVSYDTICDYPKFVSVDDGQASDQVGVVSVLSIVNKKCGRQASSSDTTVKATDTSVVADNGEIKESNVAVLTAGGPYINMVAGYAQTVGLITFNYTNANELLFMKGKEVVFNVNSANVTLSHDFLLIQMAKGDHGSVYLTAYGINGEGTAAAINYLATNPVHFYTLLEWSGGSDYKVIASE